MTPPAGLIFPFTAFSSSFDPPTTHSLPVHGSCATRPHKSFSLWSPLFAGGHTRRPRLQPLYRCPVWTLVLFIFRSPSGTPSIEPGSPIYQDRQVYGHQAHNRGFSSQSFILQLDSVAMVWRDITKTHLWRDTETYASQTGHTQDILISVSPTCSGTLCTNTPLPSNRRLPPLASSCQLQQQPTPPVSSPSTLLKLSIFPCSYVYNLSNIPICNPTGTQSSSTSATYNSMMKMASFHTMPQTSSSSASGP